MDARTEEIRARVEKDLAEELGFRIFRKDGDDRFQRNSEPFDRGCSSAGARLWDALATSRTELTALREEVERLKGALRRYGQHSEDCDFMFPEYEQPSCGFAAALSPSPAQQEEEK